MNQPDEEQRSRSAGILACFIALIVVPMAAFIAHRTQRPFRGPVLVDLGASPGLAATGASVAVALCAYAVPVAALLVWIARSAPRWAFRAVLGVALVAGLILLVVVG